MTTAEQAHDASEPQAAPPPERVRVIVRAGKADWIGIAYAPDAPQSDAIVEYVPASIADALAEALVGLSVRFNRKDEKCPYCWCNAWDWTKHTEACAAARGALARWEGKR